MTLNPMKKQMKHLKTIRNSMGEKLIYHAKIDDTRSVWGKYSHGFGFSFYFIKNEFLTDVHLTTEAAEALRLIIEKLQNETTTLGYMKISTSAHSPNKKAPLTAKKAGSKRKTKRPSLAKKKK